MVIMDDNKEKKLKVTDINSKVTLSVIATLDNKKVELPVDYAKLTAAEAVEVKANYGDMVIPLEDIVKQWQEQVLQVSFKGHLSLLELVAVDNEGVYLWDKVQIYKVKLSTGKRLNLLQVNTVEGERYNRRRGVRIAVDKNMEIQQDGELYSVRVRDLSYCGVGFIEPDVSHLKIGVPFILFLSEDSETGEKQLGRFVGKVINQRELPNGGVFDGCIISSQHSAFLQRYIARKQIEQIKGRTASGTVKRNVTGADWKNKIVDSLVESMNE